MGDRSVSVSVSVWFLVLAKVFNLAIPIFSIIPILNLNHALMPDHFFLTGMS